MKKKYIKDEFKEDAKAAVFDLFVWAICGISVIAVAKLIQVYVL